MATPDKTIASIGIRDTYAEYPESASTYLSNLSSDHRYKPRSHALPMAFNLRTKLEPE